MSICRQMTTKSHFLTVNFTLQPDAPWHNEILQLQHSANTLWCPQKPFTLDLLLQVTELCLQKSCLLSNSPARDLWKHQNCVFDNPPAPGGNATANSFCFCTEFCQGAQSCLGLGSPGVTHCSIPGSQPRPEALPPTEHTEFVFRDWCESSDTHAKWVLPNTPRDSWWCSKPFYATTYELILTPGCAFGLLKAALPRPVTDPAQEWPFFEQSTNLHWRKNPLVLKFSPNTCQSELLHLFQSIWGVFTDCFPILKLHDFQVTTQMKSVLRGTNLRNQGQRSRWWCNNCSQTVICNPSQSTAWTRPWCLLPCQSCGEYRQTASEQPSQLSS